MTEEDNSGRLSNLSRRQALAGIGSIGAAAGIGGFGTVAQLTDTEGQTGTFTAGAIDGVISTNVTYNGDDITGDTSLVTVDGQGAGATISFMDVKPGDYGTFNFSLEIENNPAWVGACLNIAENVDANNYEPEVEADSDVTAANAGPQSQGEYQSQTTTPGELPENLYLIPFYDNNADSSFFDSGATPATYTSSTGISAPSGFWSNSQSGGFSTQALGNQYLAPRTLAEVVSQPFEGTQTYNANQTSNFQTVNAPAGSDIGDGCILLDGDIGNDTNDNTQEATPLSTGTTLNFGYDWHIPFETGNEIMGDQMEVNVGFTFNQQRSSAGPNLQNTYSPQNNDGGSPPQ